MTDVDDYMTMLRESQFKRTIVVEDVDKIISENAQLKEELKEICEKYLKIKTTVSAYEDAYKDSNAYIKKLKELLKECSPYINHSAISNKFRNPARYKKAMKLLIKIDNVVK